MQPVLLTQRVVCLFRAKHQKEEYEDRNKRPKKSTGSLRGLFQGITTSLQHISIDLDGGMLAECLGCFFRVVHFLVESGQKQSFLHLSDP